MRRSLIHRTLLLLPVLLLFAACEGGAPWRDGADEETGAGREAFGPTAAYDRRLVFLGPGSDLPTAVVFDFAAMSDSLKLRRGARVRLVDGAEWVPLLDDGWEMEPMREPWRLVPRGPLRVVVGDAGELDALIFRGDVDVRLEPGPVIAEYSPDPGTQLVLRQGRLRLGDEPVAGILLDAQLARAIVPGAPRTATGAMGVPGDTATAGASEDTVVPAVGAQDTASGDAELPNDPPAESAAVAPDAAPTARAGAEALLLDNSGYYVVFAGSAEGDMAWIHTAGRDDLRPAARLVPTAWEPFPEGGTQVPVAWRVSAPGGEMGGELRAEAADLARLDGAAGPAVLGYAIVTGWVEDRGVRRNVYGLIRHVR